MWVPLLPRYVTSNDVELFSCRCRVAFHASSVGRRTKVGRMCACAQLCGTVTPPMTTALAWKHCGPFIGSNPFDGIVGKVNDGGPWSRTNAGKFWPLRACTL